MPNHSRAKHALGILFGLMLCSNILLLAIRLPHGRSSFALADGFPLSADAGQDQTVAEGVLVTLNGTANYSGIGTLSYSWAQMGGPVPVQLAWASSQKPTFTAPEIGETFAVLSFRLYVTDGVFNATDDVDIKVNNSPGYHFLPAFNATGSGTSYFTIPDAQKLRLKQFSLSAWFKTSKDYNVNAMIVNKGGSLTFSESLGQNLNYGIWLTSQEKIRAGFESQDGTDYLITTSGTKTYNDDQWHHVVLTYNQSKLVLYIDGQRGPFNSFSASPDNTGNTPFRIGANSQPALPSNSQGEHLKGLIDEVYLWNRILTGQEILYHYNTGVVDVRNLIIHWNGVTANSPPLARAGPSQTVLEGSTGYLDGTASSDPDGDALNYTWTQTGGPTVSLSNSFSSSPSFVAPMVNGSGALLKFRLDVNDGKGLSSSDTVNITVKNINQAPIANAGPNRDEPENTTVYLNGTASYDPDFDTLSYSWRQLGGPTVALSNPTNAIASFTSPGVGPSGAALVFELKVDDGNEGNSTAAVTVNVLNNIGVSASLVANKYVVDEGMPVLLDASDSTGFGLTYRFDQIAGSAGTITVDSSNPAKATFTAPTPISTDISTTVRVNVTDVYGDKDYATVSILVKHVNTPPIAKAGPTQNVNEGSMVTLNGSGSYDPDGSPNPLTYTWKQIDATGYRISLSNYTSPTPTFVSPQITLSSITLVFMLTVSDGASNSTDTVNINVNNLAFSGYQFDPSFSATGSGYYTIPDDPSLRLQRFSIGIWFKTSQNNNVDTAIVSKGGPPTYSEDPGQNLNYGIWMTSSKRIRAGFEGSDGVDYFTNSLPSGTTFNDNKWHYVVLTYNQSKHVLYIDGVQNSWNSFTKSPDIANTQPLRLGANSYLSPVPGYFNGQIDELRIWNRTLSSSEISAQFNSGVYNQAGILLYWDGVNVNRPPVAKVGSSQTVFENDTVSLSSSGSFDPDGDPLSYYWVQTSGPAVKLSNATNPSPSFVAPLVPREGATLKFQLAVGDGKKSSNVASVDIFVKHINRQPVANAGPDFAVNEGTLEVILPGSYSYDPDGDPLTYSWNQITGPLVQIEDPSAQNAVFTAPIVATNVTLTFKLTVGDGSGTTSSATVNVLVINTAGGYIYLPAFNATGTSYYSIPHHTSLQLAKFSVAAWFKTSKNVNAMIVNKGGHPTFSESPGLNLNYGIWMITGGQIRAGFESSDGTDYFVTSSQKYDDNKIHYAAVTYDKSALRLYIDGIQVGWRPINANPDVGGTQPIRIGGNSQGTPVGNLFTGLIDEVKVWKRALYATEIADLYFSGIPSPKDMLVEMDGVTHDSSPVADAGPDQVVNEQDLVMLNGSNSGDPDGIKDVTYVWSQIAGPAVTLSDSSSKAPTFVAPKVAYDTILSFRLTVSDGHITITDEVDIKVLNLVGGYMYAPFYTFTGSNYFDLKNNSGLSSQTFSISAWFKTPVAPKTEAIIMEKGALVTAQPLKGQTLNYAIWLDSLGRLKGGFGPTGTQPSVVITITSPSSYVDNNWHHAVLTFSSTTGSLVLYVDGQKVASLTTSSRPSNTGTQPMRIGANIASPPDRYFVGEIDQVGFWPRVLTASEIQDNYLDGTPISPGPLRSLGMSDVPVAKAGLIQIVMKNNQAKLNGTGSFDPDGYPISYNWTHIDGVAPVSVTNSTQKIAFAVAPSVVGERDMIMQLMVADEDYNSADKVRLVVADSDIKNKILLTPSYGNELAGEINNATKFVYASLYYVETYSGNPVLTALSDAAKRGVDVRVLFSTHTLTLYPNVSQDLTNMGITHKITPNHAKVVVIDNKTAYVGSANWNRNGLERNWEMTMKTNDPDTIREAYSFNVILWNTGAKIVDPADKYYERFTNGMENYNLLLEQIRSSKSIKMLMFEMTYNFSNPNALDSRLLNELKNAHQRGANLQIVLDDPRYYLIYGGRQFLTQNNIPHKLDEKTSGLLERLHAKTILFDDKVLFVGSHNFSFDSLGSPEEATIITRNQQTIADWLAVFDAKWALAKNPS
jgi:phosphatidylserine/phosphatidylglycerophosphate/cardiolipin synthase-like enzyme